MAAAYLPKKQSDADLNIILDGNVCPQADWGLLYL